FFRVGFGARLMGEAQRIEHQRGRFVEGVVGPVAEKHSRPVQPAGAALDECTYRDRSNAEGIPGSANGATWGDRSNAEGIPGSASGATWGGDAAGPRGASPG